MPKSSSITIGLLQMSVGWDLPANLQKAEHGVRRLAKRGAQIVCLPELFRTPYFCQSRNNKFFDLAEPIPGPTSRQFGALAKTLGVTIIVSLFERVPVGTGRDLSVPKGKTHFYNTAVTLAPSGKIVSKYRKVHIPDDPKNYYDEAYYFEHGNLGFRAVSVPVKDQRSKVKSSTIGTLICWDQWFPEGARLTVRKGANILFYPTALGWPANPKGQGIDKRLVKTVHGIMDMNAEEQDAWVTIQRSHAIANNVFVAVVNRVGRDDHIEFWGTSFVADPYGRILVKAPTNKEADLLVDCDMSLITTMRRDWPFLEALTANLKAGRYV